MASLNQDIVKLKIYTVQLGWFKKLFVSNHLLEALNRYNTTAPTQKQEDDVYKAFFDSTGFLNWIGKILLKGINLFANLDTTKAKYLKNPSEVESVTTITANNVWAAFEREEAARANPQMLAKPIVKMIPESLTGDSSSSKSASLPKLILVPTASAIAPPPSVSDIEKLARALATMAAHQHRPGLIVECDVKGLDYIEALSYDPTHEPPTKFRVVWSQQANRIKMNSVQLQDGRTVKRSNIINGADVIELINTVVTYETMPKENKEKAMLHWQGKLLVDPNGVGREAAYHNQRGLASILDRFYSSHHKPTPSPSDEDSPAEVEPAVPGHKIK